MSEIQPKLKFKKTFLWGAATSAHQVEGGNNNQWSVWELENAKVKAAQVDYHLGDFKNLNKIKKYAKNPNNYVSNSLADHYNNFEKDFDLLQKMNLNAYRFSVEWSRIEPKDGVFNPEAISHYKKYVLELSRRDIEPIVTLFHFSLPIWFCEKGGFEKRSNVKYFTRFAKRIVRELGPSVKFIVTINEPEIYAINSYYNQEWPPAKRSLLKAKRVINNLAFAHKQAYKAIHNINKRYKVSIAKNSTYYYPGDDAILSRISAHVMQYFQDDIITKKFIKNCDFLGVNYYQSNRVYGYRVHNPEDNLSDLNWPMTPGDIQFVLERLHRKFKLPIIITENGLADADDEHRKWWITETILGVQKAIDLGVDVRGYLHWSLIDNFEWAYGKWPRFGLVEIDYNDKSRNLRPSARWFGSVVKKIRGL